MKTIYLILFIFITQNILFTQNMHVYDIRTDEYPVIKAKFYVTDKDNNQIDNFNINDFQIKENQITRFIKDIKCNDENKLNKISTVLTIDVSKSMSGERLDWVKAAATQWVNDADSANEETAITTFSDNALLNIDFLNDAFILTKVIDTIEIRDGTNYKNAFLETYAGALDIASRAKYLPIIIFLTDGVGLTDFSQKEVIDRARKIGAIVYVISIDISLPKEMKDVAEATGGQYFEKIDSQEKLTDVYKIIRQIAKNTTPCELSWYTEGCVLGREAEITYNPFNLHKTVAYDTPGELFPEFEYLNDEFAVFDCNISKKYILKLKAKNGDINITGINKNSDMASCNDFTARFLNYSTPIVLPKDSILEIEITYNPTTSNFNFCEFELDASSCLNNKFYAVSNCLNSPPSNVYLKVKSPNGGEIFRANSLAQVFWSGTSKEDDILVDYSLDSGKSWNVINAGKFYNQTNWNIPNVESSTSLVRVKKMSNNAGTKVYDKNIDSNNIHNISWNKRGNLFAIITDTNSVLLVNSITGMIVNEIFLQTDTSSLKDVQFLPDGARLYVTNSIGLYLLNLITKKYDFIDSIPGDIDISNDEKFITITNSDSLVVFDLQTKTISNVFKKPYVGSIITKSSISNDSKKIAFCTSTDDAIDSIYVFEKSTSWQTTTNYKMTDTTFKYSYVNLDWSFDDKFIFTSSIYKTSRFLEVWDISKKSKVYKVINPHNVAISGLKSSKYENYFVTIDQDSKIKVWKLDFVNPLYNLVNVFNFQSNSFINNCIEWSPDGSRFAIGTSGLKDENLLAVYSVKSYPEVEDISDSVFSIVKSVYDFKPVNLGDEYIGQTKDSILTNLFLYNYSFKFIVDSVNISGNDKSSFSVSNSPNLPFWTNNTIQPDFIFSFTPVRKDIHSANLNIYTQFGVKTVNIIGNGVIPIITTENYNFGEVLITKDSIISKKSISNSGNSTLNISKISIVGPSDQYFKILDLNNNILNEIVNIKLAPNDKYDLKIIFSPLLAKVENARVKIEYLDESNKPNVKYINLYGEGINPQLLVNDVNFNSVICDDFNSQKVTITNTGRGNLSISDIQLNSLNFRILDNFNFNEIINTGDSLSFTVEFKPIDTGIIKDSILIFSNQLNKKVSKIYLNARKLSTDFIVEGNNNLVGINANTNINENFKVINIGRTPLEWSPPYQSLDGKITVISIIPNPTLPGDTSLISYQFNGGNKGESFNYKFAPKPYCSDSIDISIQIKNTNPTLYTDFDENYHLVCEDTLKIKIPITNIGEEELNITNIRFENGNTSNFNINRKILNLKENESDTLLLTFDSPIPGDYNTDIVFISNDSKSSGGKLIKHIKVTKDISNFDIIESQVDFVFVGLNNPGNKKFTIKNTGSIPIRWNLLPIANFNIISIIPPIALPNTTSEVTLVYSGPDDLSNLYTLFVNDSCQNLDSILLNVSAANDGIAVLKLDNVKRKIGEIFNFKITLTNASKLEEAGVTSIKGNLIFNHSLMIPTSTNSTITNGIRSVPFELQQLEKGAVLPIEMQVLWGDDSCSTVSIDNLVAIGNTTEIELEQIPGSICASNLCYEGGVRLIDLSHVLDANLNFETKNNNNILEIKLDLIEQGLTTINLYDLNGRKVKEIISESMGVGLKTVNTDLTNISNGPYFIEIVTPSIKLYRKLFIIK